VNGERWDVNAWWIDHPETVFLPRGAVAVEFDQPRLAVTESARKKSRRVDLKLFLNAGTVN
jgi:hypothetical protein